ncbi:hypothetical protein MHUMG1_00942 [Metarhizium humberi]|uniref:Uncharacterized protein n=1 Tax=Metarhizium humberi TaxID=2596975 RepID=A0A9P8MKD2_9HYPO|nr:hypothetical protein MHUMG1_00942 [Metarhizium humberi]
MLARLQRQQHRQPIRQVIALVRFSLDAKEPVAIAGERPAWVKAADQLAISTVGLTNLLEMNTTAVAQVNLDYDCSLSLEFKLFESYAARELSRVPRLSTAFASVRCRECRITDSRANPMATGDNNEGSQAAGLDMAQN